MNKLPSLTKNLRGEAEHQTASEASSSRLPLALSSRARCISFWAAATVTASNGIYLVALAWYMNAGFSGPEPAMTRILASLSVFSGAPALVVLVAALGSQYRPKANILARLSLVFAFIFASLAVANRILQFFVLSGLGDPSLLDLYVAKSPAQLMEFIAFGPFQGSALILASRMFPAGGLSGWARRLFALAGILTFTGGTIFILGRIAGTSFPLPPEVGLLISLPSWAILFPAATAVTTWLLRRAGGASESLLARYAWRKSQ
jgi:hypothetical protein